MVRVEVQRVSWRRARGALFFLNDMRVGRPELRRNGLGAGGAALDLMQLLLVMSI